MARHSKPQVPRGRTKPTRNVRKTYLIVCEGAKTEPNYFRAFRKNARVEEFKVVGEGNNTMSLVFCAKELKRQNPEYDEVWCVFDKDSFTADQFNTAIQSATAKKLHVAYSNEAFELWYLLHFDYCESALSRTSYGTRLTTYLGRAYEKNDATMYESLLPKQATAIQNAKRLERIHTSSSPAQHNPVTLVYRLVESLNDSASL